MQLLTYPVIDFRRLDPSHRTFAEGFLLTSASIDFYKALYAAPDDNDPAVSPIRHDHLASLPPALVVTATNEFFDSSCVRIVEAEVVVDGEPW